MAVVMLAFIVPVQTGCSTTQQTKAYQVVSASYTSVDAAMKAWGNYVATYHPPKEDELLVVRAYTSYQAATRVVIDACRMADETKETKARIDIAIKSANNALTDLMLVLQQCGITLTVGN